jgi:polysaccharide biosynthesis protein PslH
VIDAIFFLGKEAQSLWQIFLLKCATTDYRMNILFITKTFPYPIHDGTKLREYNILSNLALSHEVELICVDGSHLSMQHRAGQFSFMLSKESYTTDMSVLKGYDLIYLSGSNVILRDYTLNGVPIIADFIDNPALFMKRSFYKEKNIIRKIRILKWSLDLVQDIKKTSKVIDSFVFISQDDAEHFKKIVKAKNVFIISNGVDLNYFNPSDEKLKKDNIILFTGVMDYPPNDDAACFFIKSVLPLIREKHRDIKFLVVGKNPSQKLRKLALKYNKIEVTGFVEDMRPYFNKATVYVSPLRWGAGVKNKILEAWAMKVPVVATTLSCSGIEANDGENIYIADQPKYFAKMVCEILDNQGLRDDFAAAARSLIEKKYSWQGQAVNINSCLKKVCNQ